MSLPPTFTAMTADGTAYDDYPAGEDPVDAPVLVLIHGLGLCRQLWDQHLPALAVRHRVISYDLYGHGESAPQSDPASLSHYAAQVVHLLDHLQKQSIKSAIPP